VGGRCVRVFLALGFTVGKPHLVVVAVQGAPMVLELRYLRNLKVGTCSVGELENHKEDNNLSSFLNLPPTTLLVNRETPRQYMTFNKFTRDEYV